MDNYHETIAIIALMMSLRCVRWDHCVSSGNEAVSMIDLRMRVFWFDLWSIIIWQHNMSVNIFFFNSSGYGVALYANCYITQKDAALWSGVRMWSWRKQCYIIKLQGVDILGLIIKTTADFEDLNPVALTREAKWTKCGIIIGVSNSLNQIHHALKLIRALNPALNIAGSP